MQNQGISKSAIMAKLAPLFADEEGLLTLLIGALMISDFDDPEVAFDEGLKAFNGNRVYFNHLLSQVPGRLLPIK